MTIGTLAFVGLAATFGTAKKDVGWALHPVLAYSRCTKRNVIHLAIKGQCTNFIVFVIWGDMKQVCMGEILTKCHYLLKDKNYNVFRKTPTNWSLFLRITQENKSGCFFLNTMYNVCCTETRNSAFAETARVTIKSLIAVRSADPNRNPNILFHWQSCEILYPCQLTC